MPGKVLTMSSSISCPHGGVAQLVTSDTKTRADGAFALLETDVHTVAGCPFMMGLMYSPCIRIEWSAGASKVKVSGTPVLVQSSVGKCYALQGYIQGVAMINSTQQKVTAL